MKVIMRESKQFNLNSVRSELNDISINSLQRRLDDSEKNGNTPFDDFSDSEMIKWYLYEPKHLNEENNRSVRTVKEYERELFSFINQLLTYSAEIDVDIDYIIEGSLFKSLQGRHLRRYQEWLKTRSPHVLDRGKYSPATLSRKTTIIKSFFSFLYDVKYIREPIHNSLKIASVRTDDRPNRDLGPLDVVMLLDEFRNIRHPIMFGIIHVLTTTGIRNEEFCSLKVEDIKKDSIKGGYYLDVLGKGNKRRQVPLKEKVIRSIEMFRYARGLLPVDKSEGAASLFTTNTGRAYSPSYLSQYVKKQIANLDVSLTEKNMEITPHYFRHAFAIISKLNDVDLYSIMRSLGHEKIETTMIYLEKIFEKEQHAIHSWDPAVIGDYI